MLSSKVATLQDNSVHGEDSFLTRDLGNKGFLDVVMDGVTGHGGEEASTSLKEALAEAPLPPGRPTTASPADRLPPYYWAAFVLSGDWR